MRWWKWNKQGPVVGILVLLLQAVPFALGGTDGFYHMAAPGVLTHSAYQVYGQLGWHRIPQNGEATSKFPWSSGFRLGLFDRGEFGVEYGDRISLSGKMQFMQEEDWLPDWSFGARSVFASQEAHLQSVPDSLRELYEGELYTSVGKTFFSGTYLVAGLSVVAGLDSGRASPNWALSQKLPAGLALLYDGYWRNQNSHHNFGLEWVFRDALRVSIGLTEVDRYFYQDGEFGFFTRDRENRSADGFSAPGLYAMVSVTGFMKEGLRPTTQARLNVVEKKMATQNQRIEDLEERLDRAELQVQGMRGNRPDSVTIAETDAERALADIVRGFQTETWDARRSKKLQDSLIALGEPAWRMLIRTALRESSSPVFRETSIRIMGNSRNPRFTGVLLQIIETDVLSEQREAMIALAKIGTPEVLNGLRAYRAKAQPQILPLVDDILKTLNPAVEPSTTTIPVSPEAPVSQPESGALPLAPAGTSPATTPPPPPPAPPVLP